jgi:hypothetical protein
MAPEGYNGPDLTVIGLRHCRFEAGGGQKSFMKSLP